MAWLQWLSPANRFGVKVLPAPLVLEKLTSRVPFGMLDERWTHEVIYRHSPYVLWKRAFNVAAVILTALFSLLIAGIVTLVMFLDSGRPILVWHHRIGFSGRPFTMVGLRVMRLDAESNGNAFATAEDQRVTRTGHFLRQHRFDEIPQLSNVLRGEMRILGPRPEQLAFAKQHPDVRPSAQRAARDHRMGTGQRWVRRERRRAALQAAPRLPSPEALLAAPRPVERMANDHDRGDGVRLSLTGAQLACR